MSSSTLQIKNLSIGYKKNILVSGINLDLKKGQLIALVGRNGSGKTTWFKTISGDLEAIDGSIAIDGKEISRLNPLEKAQLLSVVYTTKPKLAGMSVFDIVAMGRHPYTGKFGRLSENDHRIIKESLLQLGISSLQNRSIDEISDGEFQKTMLARALAQNTPVILMDEPASFLDYPSKLELLDLLKNLCGRTNKLIIFSSHEIPLLVDNVDTILGIKNHTFYSFDKKNSNLKDVLQDVLDLKVIKER